VGLVADIGIGIMGRAQEAREGTIATGIDWLNIYSSTRALGSSLWDASLDTQSSNI
jgi:hypothetical protein